MSSMSSGVISALTHNWNSSVRCSTNTCQFKNGDWEFLQWHNRIRGVLEQYAGLIPGLVQWAKGSVLPELWLRSWVWLISDLWPRNSICRGAAKKKKKKRERERMEAGRREYSE